MSIRKIYRKIAKKHGTTAVEVKREIQVALTYAYQNPPDDGGITEAWQRQVPCRAEIPSADEVIQYAAAKVKKELDK
ncbi:MAG: sporulation initiation factor Spo0A C-terminal domain-containing protein [Bacillota bacterium]